MTNTLTLEQIKKNREKREQKSLSLARRFEEGASILTAEENAEGRKVIAKERFLEAITYDLEGINDDTLYTEDEAEYLRKYVTKASMAAGLNVAIRCPGANECSFANKCPWAQIGKEPTGKSCPYESALFTEYLVRYIEEFDVNPTSLVELQFCNELATTDILIARADKALSDSLNADMVKTQTTTFGKNITETYIVSPYIEVRDKLVKRRERIIKLMVGDRQEKYKKQAALKQKDEMDISVNQAKQRAVILNAQLEKERHEEEIQQAEEILTPDELLQSE